MTHALSTLFRRFVPPLLCLTAALGAAAQDVPAPALPTALPTALPLRADLTPARPVQLADGPIRVRFTLTNTGAQTIDLPLEAPLPAEGVGLPPALLVGVGAKHLLTISFQGEPAREVPSVPPPTTEGGPASRPARSFLRLAAGGVIGADVDLRQIYPAVRYAGVFRLEWRPLGPLGAAAVAEFRVETRKDAILITDTPGKIVFHLDYENAPVNVANFSELVREGFYNGGAFHRLIPGYILQGGRAKNDGHPIRPDGKLVPAELRDAPVELGALLMAHKPGDPNSASCQFFIALSRLADLDGQYTIVGRAVDPDSLRALRQLAEAQVDNEDRPVAPLFIRSISLVDADDANARRIEIRTTPATQPAGSP